MYSPVELSQLKEFCQSMDKCMFTCIENEHVNWKEDGACQGDRYFGTKLILLLMTLVVSSWVGGGCSSVCGISGMVVERVGSW